MKTLLYIKTHNQTGLKYFGKVSSNRNPYRYMGSGKYWLKHLKKHGRNVSTKIIGEFTNEKDCFDFATKFSIDNNIVKSEEWANLRMENGFDGAPIGTTGCIHTNDTKIKLSKIMKRVWMDKEYRNKVVEAQKNSWTEERRKAQTKRLKNEFWTKERRKEHSDKLKGRPGHTKCKGVPKAKGFGEKVSRALMGKPKTEQHIRNSALGKQKIKKSLVDHLDNKYELHSDFSKKYGLDFHHFYNLESKIHPKKSYEKLGIDYELNKGKTKREIGFRFE